VFSHSADSTTFYRTQDYTGIRNEIYENATLPFYFGNYLEGNIKAGIRASQYSLTSNDVDSSVASPDVSSTNFDPLPKSSDRFVPTLGGRTGTVFENVYGVESGNPIKFIGELGKLGKTQSLE